MTTGIDPYAVLAKYYDGAYASMKDLIDVPFYVDLAEKIGGPVLEIGCGTGRVLLPTARAGITIHGVDSSLPMLAILDQKIGREPPGARERIRTHNGDMRNFRLETKYPLVTIPFRPMQHMHSVEDQIRALTTAAVHLDGNGLLAFDVFYPKFEILQARLGEEILEVEWVDPSAPNRIVRRYYRKDAVDKIHQICTLTFLLRTYEGEELVLEECESLRLSYYTYPHLQALFRLTGFEVVEEYGSFSKSPLDNSATDMIFLLQRKMPHLLLT
jgi:SAM-dependent methyltransferase